MSFSDSAQQRHNNQSEVCKQLFDRKPVFYLQKEETELDELKILYN